MRALCLTPLLLAACSQGPSIDRPAGEIEAFAASDAGEAYCAFFKEGHEFVYDDQSTWQYVFVTRLGDADERARIRYSGEMLELFPRALPKDRTVAHEIIYAVEDYPSFDVRVTFETPKIGEIESIGYTGVIELRELKGGDYQPVASQRYYGDCGV